MGRSDDNKLLTHDFEDSVGYFICQASRAFERAMNDELAPRGITYRQAQVLWLLAHEGSLSQTDLAERMHIEPPTFHRHDEINGCRFTKPVDTEFTGVKVERGQD